MTTEQIQDAMNDVSETLLHFVRCYDFNLVPKRLFDQVKGSTFNEQQLLASGQAICMNPAQLLYVLVDGDNIIHGVLWAEYCSVSDWVFVNTLSVDPEFQDGTLIPDAVDFLRDELKDSVVDVRIVIATDRPDAFEKHGFQKTGSVLMEI